MTSEDPCLRAHRLAHAIQQMATRYGRSCMEQALAERGSVAHEAASRRASRRYRALIRLTVALRTIAEGTR